MDYTWNKYIQITSPRNPSQFYSHVAFSSLIAPAPTPATTVAAVVTTRTINAPTTASSLSTNARTSHSLTGHTAESPTQISTTDTPIRFSATKPRKSNGADLPTGASTVGTADPPLARENKKMKTEIVIGIIVVVITAVIITLVLIALFMFRRKR